MIQKKTLIAGAFLCLIAVIAISSYALFSKENSQKSSEIPESIAGNFLGLQRVDYKIPSGIFEGIPTAPMDFNRMVELMHSGKFQNYYFFSKAYYLQPEFYPSFAQSGLSYWVSPNPERRAVLGFGFFPQEQSVVIKRSETINARFFIHSGFGVSGFQGIKIIAKSSEDLRIEFLNSEFILGPSFPKFLDEWARAVDLKITALENSGIGTREIELIVASPSEEKSRIWAQEHRGNYQIASDSKVLISHKIRVNVLQ